MVELTKGQIFTRDCEGSYNQCEHPHVPSNNSGVTLGFGCDLKARSHTAIFKLLYNIAGLPQSYADTFANATGLKGNEAKKFLKDEKTHGERLIDFVLTHDQMDRLFQVTYAEEKAIAKRIYSKPDCESEYGWILPWEKLLQPIKDEIIDLKYRGDWIRVTRKFLSDAIRSNNLEVFAGAMSKQFFWRVRRRVPKDRFQRRIAYLEETLS